MNADELHQLDELLEQIRSMKLHGSRRLGAALKKPLLLLLLVSRIENNRVEMNRFHYDDVETKLAQLIREHGGRPTQSGPRPEQPFSHLQIDEHARIRLADAFVAQQDGGLPLESLVNRGLAVEPRNKPIGSRFLEWHRNNVYLGVAK